MYNASLICDAQITIDRCAYVVLNAAVSPLCRKRLGRLIPDALPVDNPFSLSRGGLFARGRSRGLRGATRAPKERKS